MEVTMNRFFLLFSAFLFLPATGYLLMGQPADRRTIVTTLGKDTLAVEEYVTESHRIRGTSVSRSPRTTIREYSATFTPEGLLSNVHVRYQRVAGGGLTERDYTYSDDSVNISVRQDTATTHFTLAAKDRPFPLFIDIFGIWEGAIQRALNAGAMEFSIIGGRQSLLYRIAGSPPGTFDLENIGGDFGPIHVETGNDGHLLKFDMTATTDKFVARSSPPLDVMTLAREFAERDKAGKALGILSPRDTVRAEINGARLLIDYGRPSVRGRTIFGNVVPWDSVWRTGANAATQLITDKDLDFVGVTVPAGTYSLFTLPQKDGWSLIINKKHGQWGTEYSQADDLARVPLTVKKTEFSTERFTFEIIPMAENGLLRFFWNHTEASVLFKVK